MSLESERTLGGERALPTPSLYRRLRVFQPSATSIPVRFVGADGALREVRAVELCGRVVGAYRMRRVDACRFRIVALGVDAEQRGKGIGRWLLGHAIGVAESKGARFVDAPLAETGLFAALGFECGTCAWRLRLTPE